MTAPRRIVPGSTYLLTRRTTQRQFLLRPDDQTNQAFEFCLALATRKYGIEPIAWLVMSNHYHLVAHDPRGNVPAFAQYFHRLLAAVFNARWARRENFWSSEETSMTHLATQADVVEKVLYTLANPVAARLVDTTAEWPGASSWSLLSGKTRRIARPKYFFKQGSKVVPEHVELTASRPHGSRKKESGADWAAYIRTRLAAVEARAAAARKLDPRLRSLGARAVLDQQPSGRPKTKEARKIRPHLACKEPEKRMAMLLQLKQFRIEHRDARRAWARGDTNVVFPEGTYRYPQLAKLKIGSRRSLDPDVLSKYLTRIPCDVGSSEAPLLRAS